MVQRQDTAAVKTWIIKAKIVRYYDWHRLWRKQSRLVALTRTGHLIKSFVRVSSVSAKNIGSGRLMVGRTVS